MPVRHLATGLGALIVGAVLLVAIVAPYIAPHDPFAQDLNLRLVPPEWMDGGSSLHPFGTDQLGRDYLSRLMYGARISMTIGIFTVITSGLIGITLGVLGGYFGGRVDDVVMFVITCRLSIPLILVALTVVALVGSSLTVVILTLGPAAVGALRRGVAHDHDAGAQPRLHRRGAGGRRIARAYRAARGAAEHPDAAGRGGDAGDGTGDPAGGGAVVPRAWACRRRCRPGG